MRKREGGAALCLALGLLASPAWAQDEEGGLSRPRLSEYARDILGLDEATSLPGFEEAGRRLQTARRDAGRYLSSAQEEVRRRAMRVGARGRLLGEEARGYLPWTSGGPPAPVPASDPTYQGLRSAPDITGYERLQGRPYVLGRGEPSEADPSDVRQGRMGDCYLLASLAAVAHTNPGLIEGMITENEDGTYTVRLFEQPGQLWTVGDLLGVDLPSTSRVREVVVEPVFPVLEDGRSAFARPGWGDEKEELWPLLVEKAYAQVAGSYADIGQGGQPGLALRAITGSEVATYHTPVRSPDAIAGILDAAVDSGSPTVLASWEIPLDDRRLNGDVQQWHIYTLIGRDEDGRYLLRNPHGRNHPRPLTADEVRWAFARIVVGRP